MLLIFIKLIYIYILKSFYQLTIENSPSNYEYHFNHYYFNVMTLLIL